MFSLFLLLVRWQYGCVLTLPKRSASQLNSRGFVLKENICPVRKQKKNVTIFRTTNWVPGKSLTQLKTSHTAHSASWHELEHTGTKMPKTTKNSRKIEKELGKDNSFSFWFFDLSIFNYILIGRTILWFLLLLLLLFAASLVLSLYFSQQNVAAQLIVCLGIECTNNFSTFFFVR